MKKPFNPILRIYIATLSTLCLTGSIITLYSIAAGLIADRKAAKVQYCVNTAGAPGHVELPGELNFPIYGRTLKFTQRAGSDEAVVVMNLKTGAVIGEKAHYNPQLVRVVGSASNGMMSFPTVYDEIEDIRVVDEILSFERMSGTWKTLVPIVKRCTQTYGLT